MREARYGLSSIFYFAGYASGLAAMYGFCNNRNYVPTLLLGGTSLLMFWFSRKIYNEVDAKFDDLRTQIKPYINNAFTTLSNKVCSAEDFKALNDKFNETTTSLQNQLTSFINFTNALGTLEREVKRQSKIIEEQSATLKDQARLIDTLAAEIDSRLMLSVSTSHSSNGYKHPLHSTTSYLMHHNRLQSQPINFPSSLSLGNLSNILSTPKSEQTSKIPYSAPTTARRLHSQQQPRKGSHEIEFMQ